MGVEVSDGYSLPNMYHFKIFVVEPLKANSTSEYNKGFKVLRVSAKIVKVGRDGKLRLKFVSPINPEKLVSLFEAKLIQIKIESKQKKVVNFTIEYKEPILGIVNLKLYYEDPSDISASIVFFLFNLISIFRS
jgi:hypothetical protein